MAGAAQPRPPDRSRVHAPGRPRVPGDAAESRQRITELRDLFGRLGFDRTDLDTGWGIADYDAVRTAAQAVRTAAGDAGRMPPPQTVADQLRLMSSPSTAVPGGSGPIRLNQDTGDRYDLHIPVLRFVPGGPPEVLAVGTPGSR